ncbi:MAG: HAD family phosphatase [Clostridia bacterium]|nr:HAD family phosphatase [Clostridia bacterium]
MIRGILFDFNGTLFFDSEMHMEAFRQCSASRQMPIPTVDKMVRNFFGRTNSTICREQYNPQATDKELVAFAEEKETYYRAACLADPKGMHLVEGAEELLNYLKEHQIPYGLATGSEEGNLAFYREHLSLDRWFTPKNTVYDDHTFQGKPAPDIYIKAAKKIGLSPEECIVFEDGTSGMLSALRAGVGAVIPIWEPILPSPLTEEVKTLIRKKYYHDFKVWREILAEYGL